MTKQQAHDWVAKAADDAIATASPGASVVTCASGISPSGPIHLGNLREILVPHLVAEELRRPGLEEITRLVYGVPKVALGLDLDAEPNSEIIADQKAFFRLLYQLLIGKDTGPRLPTLFLALGSKHLRRLLTVGRGQSCRDR